jgi:asparagine synthase (glutamine-hydrolysing)
MCGIAGVVGAVGPSELRRVPEVLRRLHHRGPDDQGCLQYGGGRVRCAEEWRAPEAPVAAVLLHRRLSILDVTKSGWQPMSTPDGRYWIAYNGEIYNYLELREELQRLGHSFRTRTDTEVLLAAYAEWGKAALTRFVGMFAFALLDTERETLLLARDFFGIKPLYYIAGDESLAFASEVKALLAFGDAAPQADAARTYIYLRYGICDDGNSTILSCVQQLPAAHYIEVPLIAPSSAAQRVTMKDPQPVRFWQPTSDVIDISFDEASARLRELFLESVTMHLRSDVRVGAALSGGIDSSAVVGAMRHVAPQADLHCFSYVADDGSISEERWIDVAARSGGANLHKVGPRSEDLQEDLTALTYAQDYPFGSTSIYAQFCVFRAAREAGVTVMLDGQGADEILAGYRFFMSARLASLVRQRSWKEALDFVSQCARWPGVSKSWLLLRAADYLLPPRLQNPLRTIIGKDLTPGWMEGRWFRARGIAPGTLNGTHTDHVLHEALLRTLTHTTLPGLLRYEDRNSMAFSIESRVPFLTPQLVQFVLNLPEKYIVARDGTSKAVFRAAMRGLVPDEILDRRDKIGFATPENRWLRQLAPWVDRVLSSDVARQLPCVNVERMCEQWGEIRNERSAFSPYVWRWLNLIQWTDQFQVQWA